MVNERGGVSSTGGRCIENLQDFQKGDERDKVAESKKDLREL